MDDCLCNFHHVCPSPENCPCAASSDCRSNCQQQMCQLDGCLRCVRPVSDDPEQRSAPSQAMIKRQRLLSGQVNWSGTQSNSAQEVQHSHDEHEHAEEEEVTKQRARSSETEINLQLHQQKLEKDEIEALIKQTAVDFGKVEQDIGKVEQDIGKVEEYIGKVEEDIEKVEDKIDELEQQLRVTTDSSLKEQLGNEKAQLRKKEEQLRKKEEQLRNEKAQLRELLLKKEEEKVKLRAELREKEQQITLLREKEKLDRQAETRSYESFRPLRITYPVLPSSELIGREIEIAELYEVLDYATEQTQPKTVYGYFNMARSGKTMMGLHSLKQLREYVEQQAPSTTLREFPFHDAISNGLHIYVNFNRKGQEDTWQQGEETQSPAGWIGLRLLARGFYGIPTPALIASRSITPREASGLKPQTIMDDIVRAHRSEKQLAENAPVLVILQLDEHQLLQSDLAQKAFQNKNERAEEARRFVEEVLHELVSVQIADARVIILLTATINFPITDNSKFMVHRLGLPLLNPLTVYHRVKGLLPDNKTFHVHFYRNLVSLGFLAVLFPNLLKQLKCRPRTVDAAVASCAVQWETVRQALLKQLHRESLLELLLASMRRTEMRATHPLRGSNDDAVVSLEDLIKSGAVPYEEKDTAIVVRLPAILLNSIATLLHLPHIHEVCKFPIPQGTNFETTFLHMLCFRLNYLLTNKSTVKIAEIFGIDSSDFKLLNLSAKLQPNHTTVTFMDERPTAEASLKSSVAGRAFLVAEGSPVFDCGVDIPLSTESSVLPVRVQIKTSNSEKTRANITMLKQQARDYPHVLFIVASQATIQGSNNRHVEMTESDEIDGTIPHFDNIVVMTNDDLEQFATSQLKHIFLTPTAIAEMMNVAPPTLASLGRQTTGGSSSSSSS